MSYAHGLIVGLSEASCLCVSLTVQYNAWLRPRGSASQKMLTLLPRSFRWQNWRRFGLRLGVYRSNDYY
jgi:hypothetical protein